MNQRSPETCAYLQSADTIVVKVGSRVLSGSDGRLDTAQVANLSAQLVRLADSGKQVVLVSSGAVASGVGKLGLASRPNSLAELQAVAAVGQAHLIQAYDHYLTSLGRTAGQVLLTAEDLDHRTRYLNVRNTLRALLQMRVIPIINENDTVAIEELQTTFGDNDRLAATVTGLFSRPALIILSDVAGVFDRDPALPGASVLSTVEKIDQQILDLAVSKKSGIGKGGMSSKLTAARMVTRSGAPAVIAGGRTERVLDRLLAGEELGTLFCPEPRRDAPRKRWIGSAIVVGSIVVDQGAEKALLRDGSSLLAIGIRSLQGSFDKGDIVSIRNQSEHEIARGLTNYSSIEVSKIRGLRSPQIEQVLGHCPYEAVVHRDNMTIVSSDTVTE
ncbi:MAG: glutamate 5-kinase [Planctomycetales bacterium]|nr:glutamate 5-kinase [Planctomycetales bacterium]